MSILAGLLTSAPQSPAPQLIDLDGTIFVQLGLFLLLLLILRRFLWDPYLRVRGERVSRVDGYREAATAMDADAAARLTRTEAQLAEARRIGTGVRATARTEAQAREQTVLAEATAAAQKTLAEARARLNGVLDGERAKLTARAAEIGREAASKILRREVAR